MNGLILFVRLQARVSAFLAELSLDRLEALVEGRAQLAVVDRADAFGESRQVPYSTTPAPPTAASSRKPASTGGAASTGEATVPPVRESSNAGAGLMEPDSVAAQLRACQTLDEATERLAALKLSAAHLKLVAKALNIPAGRTKDETAKRILALTVGSRSKHAGLRQG